MNAEVISIILKSVLGGKSINELISGIKEGVIDEISEMSMELIEDLADKSRDKLDNVLSEKNLQKLHISNPDYVIAEVKDILTHIKIDNELLECCQYNVEELKDFLWDYYKTSHDDTEVERDIQKGINAVADVLMDLFYKSEEFTPILLIAINRNVNTVNEKLDNTYQMLQKVSDKEDEIYKVVSTSYDVPNRQRSIEKKSCNRTEEYAAVWNRNMFLNNFYKWDEKAGTNVKLSEVYLEKHLPHYIWMSNRVPQTNLKELLSEYIVNQWDNKMLLILGQPGIGKSTLITWILANFEEQRDKIMVYKFASDLKSINYQKVDAFENILEKLDLLYSDLSGKTLILDGFDEINVGDARKKVLDLLYWYLEKNQNIKGLSLIITCRENYIPDHEQLQCSYITLQPWDELQIKSFCKIYGEKTDMIISENTIKNIIEKAEILGIPLILYMVLALNISIENNHSMVDVYDKVFALEGGIYDRCIDYKGFGEPHRIEKIKKQIHQISKEIAVWIFENNPDGERISKIEYEKICEDITYNRKEDISIKQDILIGTYFAQIRHCEKTEIDSIYFIHRTIYEYYVVEAIYSSIKDFFAASLEKDQEIFIKNLVKYLKIGQISVTIGEFIQHKILKLYNRMEDDEKKNFWKWLEKIVEKMMKIGMLNYVENEMKKFDYVMEHEAICFRNVMYLLSLLAEVYPSNQYILSTIDGKTKQFYLQLFSTVSQFPNSYYKKKVYNLTMKKMDLWGFNLDTVVLKNADFKYSKFINQDMKNAILEYADFECAELKGIDLSWTNLEHANFKDSNLRGARFVGARLRDADMRGADLRDADMRKANLAGANLTNLKIDGSLWSKSDLRRVIIQLKLIQFSYIKVEDEKGNIKKVSKNDILRLFYVWSK